MSQRKLDHLTNLGHLLAAATDIIVTNFFGVILIVSIDRFPLVKKGGGGCYNTILAGVNVDNLELYRPETTSDDEGITLLDWAVAVLEVWNEVCRSNVASDTLY